MKYKVTFIDKLMENNADVMKLNTRTKSIK